VSERPKEHASKACEVSRPPWVQIPPPPPASAGLKTKVPNPADESAKDAVPQPETRTVGRRSCVSTPHDVCCSPAIMVVVPELILPTKRLHTAFLECLADWGPGQHEDGFGITEDDTPGSPEWFTQWVQDRLRFTHPVGTPCPPQRHGSPRWIVEDDHVLGGIVLRHQFNDDVGHVGYGIRPSARRRGLASWALGEMLVEARAALQVDRVLVPCLADNIASARTIERCGGVLEGVRDTPHGTVRRYWIAT
jgi:predicted acetyltransferase